MGLPSACRAGPGVLDGPIQGVVCDLLPALAPDHAVVGASGELLVVGHGLDVPDGPSSFCRGDNLHPTPHADQGQGNRTTPRKAAVWFEDHPARSHPHHGGSCDEPRHGPSASSFLSANAPRTSVLAHPVRHAEIPHNTISPL